MHANVQLIGNMLTFIWSEICGDNNYSTFLYYFGFDIVGFDVHLGCLIVNEKKKWEEMRFCAFGDVGPDIWYEGKIHFD